MSDDPFDDPGLKAYLIHAKAEMFPKMKKSALSLTIVGEPDPKICLEVGAALFFDKPLILLVPPGRQIPINLRRVAAAVIEGDPQADPEVHQKLVDAISNVIANDERSKTAGKT